MAARLRSHWDAILPTWGGDSASRLLQSGSVRLRRRGRFRLVRTPALPTCRSSR